MEDAIRNNIITPEQAEKYEEIIWERAGEFSLLRNALQKRIEEMDILFEQKPSNTLNLYEIELRQGEEKEYWEIKGKIDEIKREEDKLENLLLSLSDGTATLEDVESLVPEEDSEQRKISKRKAAILREKQRMGVDPINIIGDMYAEFGKETMHLTTGRHARKIKNLGTMDPLSAAHEFYYRTTDTHGGKVSHGKKSPSYVGASGRRIRKK